MSLSSITITSLMNWVSPVDPPSPNESRGPASHLLLDFDITTTSEQILDNFQYLNTEAQCICDPSQTEFNKFVSVVQEASQLGNDILAYFWGQIDNAAKNCAIPARFSMFLTASGIMFHKRPRSNYLRKIPFILTLLNWRTNTPHEALKICSRRLWNQTRPY